MDIGRVAFAAARHFFYTYKHSLLLVFKKYDKFVKRNCNILNMDIYKMGVEQREELMYEGLHAVLDCILGDYLGKEPTDKMARLLKRIRCRPGDMDFAPSMCPVISEGTQICNPVVPRKRLGREEVATLFYNIYPYALITRKEAAQLLKCCFPNYFASVVTINTNFNRRQKMPEPSRFVRPRINLPDFSDHTVEGVEEAMLHVAIDMRKQK